jgi:hypothetical protein
MDDATRRHVIWHCVFATVVAPELVGSRTAWRPYGVHASLHYLSSVLSLSQVYLLPSSWRTASQGPQIHGLQIHGPQIHGPPTPGIPVSPTFPSFASDSLPTQRQRLSCTTGATAETRVPQIRPHLPALAPAASQMSCTNPSPASQRSSLSKYSSSSS